MAISNPSRISLPRSFAPGHDGRRIPGSPERDASRKSVADGGGAGDGAARVSSAGMEDISRSIHSSQRIPELDGLRGLAIGLVLLWHCLGSPLDPEMAGSPV